MSKVALHPNYKVSDSALDKLVAYLEASEEFDQVMKDSKTCLADNIKNNPDGLTPENIEKQITQFDWRK